MKKRGISPLIATVLIIGFTIVLAAVVIQWGGSIVEKLKQDSDLKLQKQMIASELKFDVKEADVFGNKTRVVIDNSGSRKIDGFKIRIFGNKGSKIIDTNLGLNSFEAKSFDVGFDKDKVGNVEKIETFPIINIDGDNVTFSEISSSVSSEDESLISGVNIKNSLFKENLILYYNFDEGAGNTLNDLSDNKYIGNINGANWVEGKSDKALNFDGSTNYVYIPSFNINYKPAKMTFAFWIKDDPTFPGQTFITDGTQLITGYIWIRKNTGGIGFQYGTGTTRPEVLLLNYFPVLAPPVWKYVTIVADYDTDILTVYKNGVLFSTQNMLNAIPPHSNSLYIGSFPGSSSKLKGAIGEIIIWDRALTPEEVQDAYNSYN